MKKLSLIALSLLLALLSTSCMVTPSIPIAPGTPVQTDTSHPTPQASQGTNTWTITDNPTELPVPIATQIPDTPYGPPVDKEVYLKGADRSISPIHYYILKNDRIWIKERKNPEKGWKLFAGDGNPGTSTLIPLKTISMDGENVIAVGYDRSIYYAKNKIDTTDSEHGQWFSTYRTLPFNIGTILNMVYGVINYSSDTLSMAISQRGPTDLYYEDDVGNRHPVSVGVTTCYFLDSAHRIYYADPWGLEARYYMLGPDYGGFITEKIDASASTVFAIDAYGRLRTRLTDFDIDGHDPFLSYASRFEVKKQTYDDIDDVPSLTEQPRVMGSQLWKKEPMIRLHSTDFITDAITIITTGRGSASRELRVEGGDSIGRTGYWYKKINDTSWKFRETGHKLIGRKITNYNANLDTLSDEELQKRGVAFSIKSSNYAGTLEEDNIILSNDNVASVSIKNLYKDAMPLILTIKTTDQSTMTLEYYEVNTANYLVFGSDILKMHGFLTYPKMGTSLTVPYSLYTKKQLEVLKLLFDGELSREVVLKFDDKNPTSVEIYPQDEIGNDFNIFLQRIK